MRVVFSTIYAAWIRLIRAGDFGRISMKVIAGQHELIMNIIDTGG